MPDFACPECGHDDTKITGYHPGFLWEPGFCDIECLCSTRAWGCDCTYEGEVTLL